MPFLGVKLLLTAPPVSVVVSMRIGGLSFSAVAFWADVALASFWA
jgi:hypothetical protein